MTEGGQYGRALHFHGKYAFILKMQKMLKTLHLV
jgi:hypothetical protein